MKHFAVLRCAVLLLLLAPAASRADSVWIDVNGDGIRDEVIQSATAGFDYYIYYWYTYCYDYAGYAINDYWFPWGYGWGSLWDYTSGFSTIWEPDPFWQWYQCVTWVEPAFSFQTQAGYEYRIDEDYSGGTSYPSSSWSPILSSDGFGTGTQYHYPGGNFADSIYLGQYFLTKISKPVGAARISTSTGGVLLNSLGVGGEADVILPSNGQLSFAALDTLGNVISSGAEVAWKVTDELGGIIQDWTVGVSLLLGDTDHDTIFVYMKLGSILAAAPVKVRKIRVILEPITTSGGVPPRNPSGLELGTQGTFELKFGFFAGVPDNDITWSTSGGVSFVGGNNKGKVVSVTGTSLGLKTLEVDIVGLSGPKPTVTTNVYTKNTVQVKVYVVRETGGGNPAATQSTITAMLNRANDIYKQAAMEFVQNGGITYIDNTAFLEIQSASNWAEGLTLCSTASGTGGLELYFVDTLEGDTAGLHVPQSAGAASGLMIEGSAGLNVLAHELGHACDLADIYIDHLGGSLPNDKVKQSWLPSDWNSGPGPEYYARGLTQRELAEYRLLMYGKGTGSGNAIVLPRGSVHGVKSDGSLGLVNVGLAGTNRNPTHP